MHRFRHFRRHQRPERGIERARCTAEQFARENARRFSVMRSTRSSARRLKSRACLSAASISPWRWLRRARSAAIAGSSGGCARGRRIAELLAPRIDIGEALLEAFGRRAQIVAQRLEAGARLDQARVDHAFAANRLLDLVEREPGRIETRERRRQRLPAAAPAPLPPAQAWRARAGRRGSIRRGEYRIGMACGNLREPLR